jgi:hypothetical protein
MCVVAFGRFEMKFTKLVCAAVFVPLMAFGANAATVVNGSFETTPGFNRSNYGNFSSIPGWTTPTPLLGIEVQNSGTLGFAAADGKNYVELDSDTNVSIEQSILFSAGDYILSFFYSPRVNAPGSNTNDMIFKLAGGGATVVGGSVLNAPNTSYPHGAWTEVRKRFTIMTDGSYTLQFAASGKPESLGAFIDDVSLAPIPVPAAGFLLIGALGGLVALRRRKTAA